MANPNKAKGTWMENAAVEGLRHRWPACERRAQRGIHDAGDVAGTPYTVEVKSAKVNLTGFWKEAQRESKENGNQPPVVIFKRRGSAKPLEQWVLMDVETFLRVAK